MAPTSDPSTWEVEARDLEVQGHSHVDQLDLHGGLSLTGKKKNHIFLEDYNAYVKYFSICGPISKSFPLMIYIFSLELSCFHHDL